MRATHVPRRCMPPRRLRIRDAATPDAARRFAATSPPRLMIAMRAPCHALLSACRLLERAARCAMPRCLFDAAMPMRAGMRYAAMPRVRAPPRDSLLCAARAPRLRRAYFERASAAPPKMMMPLRAMREP